MIASCVSFCFFFLWKIFGKALFQFPAVLLFPKNRHAFLQPPPHHVSVYRSSLEAWRHLWMNPKAEKFVHARQKINAQILIFYHTFWHHDFQRLSETPKYLLKIPYFILSKDRYWKKICSGLLALIFYHIFLFRQILVYLNARKFTLFLKDRIIVYPFWVSFNGNSVFIFNMFDHIFWVFFF